MFYMTKDNPLFYISPGVSIALLRTVLEQVYITGGNKEYIEK